MKKSIILNTFCKLINESLSYEYKVPSDRETRLYDFYLLSLYDSLLKNKEINKEGSIKPGWDESTLQDLKDIVHNGLELILKEMKTDLLDATALSISAELRHAFSDNQTEEAHEVVFKSIANEKLRSRLASFFTHYVKESALGSGPSWMKKHRNWDDDSTQGGTKKDYTAAKRAFDRSKMTYQELGQIGQRVFLLDDIWSSLYGGKRWADISKSLIDLDQAKSTPDIVNALDHIIDLEHNTGLMLNKVARFKKNGGFSWIKEALDLKAKATPWELALRSSLPKDIVGRINRFTGADKNLDQVSKGVVRSAPAKVKDVESNGDAVKIMLKNLDVFKPERSSISFIYNALKTNVVFVSKDGSLLLFDWSDVVGYIQSKIKNIEIRHDDIDALFSILGSKGYLMIQLFDPVSQNIGLVTEPKKCNEKQVEIIYNIMSMKYPLEKSDSSSWWVAKVSSKFSFKKVSDFDQFIFKSKEDVQSHLIREGSVKNILDLFGAPITVKELARRAQRNPVIVLNDGRWMTVPRSQKSNFGFKIMQSISNSNGYLSDVDLENAFWKTLSKFNPVFIYSDASIGSIEVVKMTDPFTPKNVELFSLLAQSILGKEHTKILVLFKKMNGFGAELVDKVSKFDNVDDAIKFVDPTFTKKIEDVIGVNFEEELERYQDFFFSIDQNGSVIKGQKSQNSVLEVWVLGSKNKICIVRRIGKDDFKLPRKVLDHAAEMTYNSMSFMKSPSIQVFHFGKKIAEIDKPSTKKEILDDLTEILN